MNKRLLSLMLVFCALISVFPIQINADKAQSMTQDAAMLDTSFNTESLTYASAENPAEIPTNKTSNPFIDVPEGEWYHDAVLSAYRNGLFAGTSETTFSPYNSITRGMYVTVLGRMSGITISDYTKSSFADVPVYEYYAPYVAWAVEKGIAKGTGESEFEPDGLVTRQQMAVFMARLFDAYGYSYPSASINTVPNDLNQVEDYAKDAVIKWWSCGIFVGYNGNFNPNQNANRAEAAALLIRITKQNPTPSYKINYNDRSGNGTNDGSNGGGDTVTTYYEVKFELGDGQEFEGISLPETKVYASGTRISNLPRPYMPNCIFLGWYYDSAMKNKVKSSDIVNKNMTLYAKMEEGSENFSPDYTPNYLTQTNAGTDFEFFVKAESEDEVRNSLEIIDITSVNQLVSYSVNSENGYFKIVGSYMGGHTYKAELADDSYVVFYYQGNEYPKTLRTLNFIIEKEEVENLKLSGNIKYLSVDDVSNMTGAPLDGLITVKVKNGVTETQENKYDGTFDYTGNDIAIGDTVAIYEGTRPDMRTKDTPEEENGAVAYVKITAVNGTTYTYSSSDTKDVLFKPDVLPVAVTADTDGDLSNNSITVFAETMDFSGDEYTIYGLDSQTTVDIGDFIGFYTGTFGQEGAQISHYGRITDVRKDENNRFIITYVDVNEDDVMASMDIYHSREEKVELTDEQISEMEESIEKQAIDSGFVEESVKYLTGLALNTDGFNELSEDMNLKSFSIETSDGKQLALGKETLMSGGSRVKITKQEVSATVAAGKVLQHFDSSYGVRAELALNFVAEVSPKQGSDNKIEISVQALFEQEILLSTNISGGAIWKWAWIIPYIYDYNLTKRP